MNEFKVEKRSKKDYVQFTCRIEKDLLEKSKIIVLDNDLKSLNQFLNDCIRHAIKNLKIEEEE